MVEELITLEAASDEIQEFIGNISIFNGLSQDALSKISDKIKTNSYAKDLTIIEKGSVGTHLHIIKSGNARVVTGA